MLDLDPGPHTLAFREFVAILMEDPDLSREVKNWTTYDGDRDNDALPSTVNELPYIRISPQLGPWSRAASWGAAAVADSPVFVTIETAVAGTNWDDSANLWAAIHRRIYSQDPVERAAVNARLEAAGIYDLEIVQPAASINDSGSPFAVATGKFKLCMMIDA